MCIKTLRFITTSVQKIHHLLPQKNPVNRTSGPTVKKTYNKINNKKNMTIKLHFAISELGCFFQISVVNLHSVHAFKILRCPRSRRFSTQHQEGGVQHGFWMKFLQYCFCWINMLSDSKNDMLKMHENGRSLIGFFCLVNFHPMEVNKHSSNHSLGYCNYWCIIGIRHMVRMGKKHCMVLSSTRPCLLVPHQGSCCYAKS